MERLVSSTVPTSDIVATATVVGGFTIEQSDHQGGNWSFTRNCTAKGTIANSYSYSPFGAVETSGNESTLNPTQDAYHGDPADSSFHPLLTEDGALQYGAKKDEKCKCLTSVEDIKDCIRGFAKNYSGTWSYPLGQNCHSFQKSMMVACCLEKP